MREIFAYSGCDSHTNCYTVLRSLVERLESGRTACILVVGGVMNTKMTIAKWLLIIYCVSLLPAPLYVLGGIIIYWKFFFGFVSIFNGLFPMPKSSTLIGLLKRRYMINKMSQSQVPTP